MKEKLMELAVKLFLTKSTAKTLVKYANEKLAKVCNLQGKETYIGYTEDAMKELAIRAESLSDDGKINAEELEQINNFDLYLIDKYWKEG